MEETQRRSLDPRANLFRAARFPSDEPGLYFVEIEVIAEAQLVGAIRFGNINFQPWDFSDRSPGEKRLMYLRLPSRVFGGDGANITEEHYQSFHTGLSPAEEFVTLTSLALRRRLHVGAQVKSGDSPSRHERRFRPYPELTEGENVSIAVGLLEDVELLPSKIQRAFLLATRFYHQGLMLSDRDPELAYLQHVSALEILSARKKLHLQPEEVIDKGAYELLQQIDNSAVREKLTKYLHKREGIKAAVIKLAREYVQDDFFVKHPEEPDLWINSNNIESLIKNVYNARSDLLHSGIPLPDDVLTRSSAREELSFGIPLRHGWRDEDSKDALDPNVNSDRIPNLAAFERLTRHILLNFARQNADRQKFSGQNS